MRSVLLHGSKSSRKRMSSDPRGEHGMLKTSNVTRKPRMLIRVGRRIVIVAQVLESEKIFVATVSISQQEKYV